jgi:hypothetical protein
MASEYGPEFDKWVEHCRKELIPMIKGSNIFVSITPSSPEKVDIKFAVELGLAIMLDKPIVAAIRPGTPIPEKLARVVDKFVEVDFDDPTQRERLMQACEELLEKEGN